MIPGWVAPYIGLEFEEHGRTRSGVDCWGLIKLVLVEHFAIQDVPDYRTYENSTHVRSVARAYLSGKKEARWTEIPAGAEKEGDVILLKAAGVPTHCGMVIVPGTMLHILNGIGSCLDGYWRPRWKSCVEGFYRHSSSC